MAGCARDGGVAVTTGRGKIGRGSKLSGASERSGESGRGAQLYHGSGRGTGGDHESSGSHGSSTSHRHGDRNSFSPVAGSWSHADSNITGDTLTETAKPRPIYPSSPMVRVHAFIMY